MTRKSVSLILIAGLAVPISVLLLQGALFAWGAYRDERHAEGKNRSIEDIRREQPGATIVDAVLVGDAADWSIRYTHGERCYRVWYSPDGTRKTDGPMDVAAAVNCQAKSGWNEFFKSYPRILVSIIRKPYDYLAHPPSQVPPPIPSGPALSR